MRLALLASRPYSLGGGSSNPRISFLRLIRELSRQGRRLFFARLLSTPNRVGGGVTPAPKSSDRHHAYQNSASLWRYAPCLAHHIKKGHRSGLLGYRRTGNSTSYTPMSAIEAARSWVAVILQTRCQISQHPISRRRGCSAESRGNQASAPTEYCRTTTLPYSQSTSRQALSAPETDRRRKEYR